MSAFEEQPCVGMFGACGDSTFRQDLLIPAYEQRGIRYYNPQVGVGEWVPEFADDEADHVAYDMVQTWPVLDSTYALRTLSESGFSVASSIRAESPLPKFIIPMIVETLDPALDDPVAREASLGARQLVRAHMAQNTSPNVFVVESLDQMLEASIVLYGVASQIVDLTRSYNPAYKRFMEGRDERIAFREAMESGRLGPAAQRIADT